MPLNMFKLLKYKNYFIEYSRKFCSSRLNIDTFRQILGENNVKTEDLDSYNTDWLRTHKGHSNTVLFPNSTEQLSQLMSYCNRKTLKCVIQGGNTSLVAGAVPSHDEIIISMAKMNCIESFDATSGVLRCQSGCILQTLEEYVNECGYIMPYDLGAKGSCQIGGNLSTNAGGLRFIRYGSLHGSVLGIEVVLPDGEILNLMSVMRKDNTGYDLKHLFIGAEGTLGIITKAAILCPLKPAFQTIGFFGLNSFDMIIEAYQCIRRELSEYLSAFEMMDSVSIDAVINNLNLALPLSNHYPFYVLIELSSNDANHADERLSQTLEKLISKNVIIDGTYSSDTIAMRKLWAYRERIAEGLLKDGYSYKYDVSLPINQYYKLVEVMRDRLKGTQSIKICGYGHLGDCNLHFNVTSAQFDDGILKLIEPFIYDYISKRNGSISAEHGLGLKKKNYMHFSKSPESIVLMKRIKQLLDPNGIVNPGKVLPDQ